MHFMKQIGAMAKAWQVQRTSADDLEGDLRRVETSSSGELGPGVISESGAGRPKLLLPSTGARDFTTGTLLRQLLFLARQQLLNNRLLVVNTVA